MIKIWIALKVECMLASWSGWLPNAPGGDASRRCTKSERRKSLTYFFVPAVHDKSNYPILVKSVFPVHDTQGVKSPVDGIQAQVSGHMVCKIVFTLFPLESKNEKTERCLQRTYISQGLDVRDMSVHEQGRSHRRPQSCKARA